MSAKVQIIGLTRFSYPANLEAFSHEAPSHDELIEHLYDQERLEQRFNLFERITLPSLRHQTDRDFALPVLIGEKLPTAYKERLHALLADLPQAEIITRPEGLGHKSVCQDILLSSRSRTADIVAEFRMDDDDAVAIDFVEKTRASASSLLPIVQSTGRVELDFCHGIVVCVDAANATAYQLVAQHWTPAQVFLCLPDAELTMMNFRHGRFWERNTCLTISKPVMFVRGAHETNDSSLDPHRVKGKVRDVPINRLKKTLSDRFKISLDDLV